MKTQKIVDNFCTKYRTFKRTICGVFDPLSSLRIVIFVSNDLHLLENVLKHVKLHVPKQWSTPNEVVVNFFLVFKYTQV